MRTYNRNDQPTKSSDDPNYSVDVIVVLDGMLNIGYYNFINGKWVFHTDTLTDPDEAERFEWYYAPYGSEQYPDSPDDDLKFRSLVEEMRSAQRSYFKHRSPEALNWAKEFEGKVDSELSPQKQLF